MLPDPKSWILNNPKSQTPDPKCPEILDLKQSQIPNPGSQTIRNPEFSHSPSPKSHFLGPLEFPQLGWVGPPLEFLGTGKQNSLEFWESGSDKAVSQSR